MIPADDRVLKEAVSLRDSELLRYMRELRLDTLERLSKVKVDADFRALQGEARTLENLITLIVESRDTLARRGGESIDMSKLF